MKNEPVIKARGSAKEISAGCLSLFGLPFLLAGLFIVWMFVSSMVSWWTMRMWQEMQCRIVAAELKESRNDGSSSYEAAGRYVYHWEGREYESDRVSISSGADNLGDYQQRVHREMADAMEKRDGMWRCYVNPGNPTQAVLIREFRPEQTVFFSVFCLFFPLVGGGLVWGGVAATRAGLARRRLQMEHPDEPWKWDSKWNQSPMPETGVRVGRFLLPVALWWLLVTTPLLLTGLASGVFTGPSVWWMAAPGAFFAISMMVVLRAVREHRRIGKVGLEITTPLRPGVEIKGAWITGQPLRPLDAPVLRVICQKTTTTRSGGKTQSSTTTVWECEEPLDAMAQSREISYFRLPFRLQLPPGAMESGEADANTKHAWKIELRIPGTPVKSEFEIPVFRREGDAPPEEPVVAPEMRAEDASRRLPELLARAGLLAEFDAGGELAALTCTARRWRQSILFLVFFNLIWTGAAVFLVVSDAPLVFKLFWPVTAAGIWLIAFYQLLGRQEMRITGQEMRISRSLLFSRRETSFAAGEVLGFRHSTNTRVNSTSFYKVSMELVGGKSVKVADGIAGEEAALGIMSHLERWRATHAGP